MLHFGGAGGSGGCFVLLLGLGSEQALVGEVVFYVAEAYEHGLFIVRDGFIICAVGGAQRCKVAAVLKDGHGDGGTGGLAEGPGAVAPAEEFAQLGGLVSAAGGEVDDWEEGGAGYADTFVSGFHGEAGCCYIGAALKQGGGQAGGNFRG